MPRRSGLRLGLEDLPEVRPRLGFMEGKLRNALVTVLPLKDCDCWWLWVTEVAPILCTSELSGHRLGVCVCVLQNKIKVSEACRGE